MGFAHVGDEAAGGLCRLGEGLDVAGVAGPHLNDGYLVAGGQAEEGLGHTHVVVEVALGVEHVVFLGEHSGNQLLGGGFAVGASNADHRDVELATVLTGQVLKGL